MQDYTREEFAEILQSKHKMSSDVEGSYFSLLEVDVGALEMDLNYKIIHLSSGVGPQHLDHAMNILCDSYRTMERKLMCFYEMLEIVG